ncbi:MAG TPA: MmcQ/YjbR family DNA-binding protein [Candidatus Dormibacteraeota bacterium]|nr:MmcQ/YjbR family DNA-binding protein [Candidatus Dormibacteraeota bacterium]
MTSRGFQRLALGFPETAGKAHQSHPDFRVVGKVFATLGYPDASWAMVKLTPEQQAEFVSAEPAVFVPVNGGWGRKGATNVKLRPAKIATVRSALAAAWCNRAPKHLARKFEAQL